VSWPCWVGGMATDGGSQNVTWSSAFFVKSAPQAWLMNLNRLWLLNFFVLIMIGFSMGLVSLSGRAGTGFTTLYVGLILAVGVVAVMVWRSSLSPMATEVLTVVALIGLSAGTGYAVLTLEDHLMRQRSLALQLILWKPFPSLLGMRMLPATIFMVVSTANDAVVHWLTQLRFGDTISDGIYVHLIVWPILYLGSAGLQQIRLRSWHDVQLQLAAEKEAFASLLAMVCDAAVWVAADGDTVLSSDLRFDSVMGHAMQNAKLSKHVPDGEETRLQLAMVNTRQEGPSPVSTLPVTLLRRAAKPVVVDVFIVDRRSAFVMPGQPEPMDRKRGFLLGLRVHQAVVEGLEPCWENDEAMPLSSLAGADKFQAMVQRRSSGRTSFPRISLQKKGKVRLPVFARSSCSVSTASSCSEAASEDTSSSEDVQRDLGCAFEPRFGPSTAYLTECSLSMLEDLVSCWNFHEAGCCRWHSTLRRLSEHIAKMHGWHSCTDQSWPPECSWQCSSCSAVLNAETAECWLCSNAHNSDDEVDRSCDAASGLMRHRGAVSADSE